MPHLDDGKVKFLSNQIKNSDDLDDLKRFNEALSDPKNQKRIKFVDIFIKKGGGDYRKRS